MAAVPGVGGVDEPVPPVALAYQSKLAPEAVRADAGWLRQSWTGLVTMGAAGSALTVTVMGTLGLSHWFVSVWLTYQVFVPAVVVSGVGAVGVPVPSR